MRYVKYGCKCEGRRAEERAGHVTFVDGGGANSS